MDTTAGEFVGIQQLLAEDQVKKINFDVKS